MEMDANAVKTQQTAPVVVTTKKDYIPTKQVHIIKMSWLHLNKYFIFI